MNLKHVIKKFCAPDIFFAIIFSSFSLLFILWTFLKQGYSISIIFLPFVVFISSTAYLFYSHRFFDNFEVVFNTKDSVSMRLASHIVFVVSLSLMMWIFFDSLYYRSVLYFFLILMASLSIILNIIYLNNSNYSELSIVLYKILIFAFLIYRDIYYQFPSIRGIDPWVHNQWILEIIETNYISTGFFYTNQYYIFPLFHITAAVTHIITGISVYSSIFISIGLVLILSYLFIFVIGKNLFSLKIGLFSMIIVALNPYNISRATAIIPMSLGYIFFIEIFYCVFRSTRATVSYKILIVILSLSLIFTHTIASFVTFICLISVFLVTLIYKKISLNDNISYNVISFSTLLFFGTTVLYKWTQDQPGRWSFLHLNITQLIDAIKIDSQFLLDSQSNVYYNISPLVGIYDNFSFYIILGFGIIGCLISLRTKKEDIRIINLLLLSGLLAIIPYLFMAFKLNNILPSRWFIFLYVPLSFFFVVGLVKVSDLFKNKGFSSLFTICIILTSVFFMTTNSLSNDDSPLYFNGVARLGYTQSEINAISTIFGMKTLNPITDIYYYIIIPHIIGHENYTLMIKNENDIFIQRNYYLNNPEWNYKYMSNIKNRNEMREVVFSEYIMKNRMDENPFIYNNGNVKAYLMRLRLSEES